MQSRFPGSFEPDRNTEKIIRESDKKKNSFLYVLTKRLGVTAIEDTIGVNKTKETKRDAFSDFNY